MPFFSLIEKPKEQIKLKAEVYANKVGNISLGEILSLILAVLKSFMRVNITTCFYMSKGNNIGGDNSSASTRLAVSLPKIS